LHPDLTDCYALQLGFLIVAGLKPVKAERGRVFTIGALTKVGEKEIVLIIAFD